MTKSYATVMKQIAALKVEAEKLRRNEVDGVIARIREAIEHYGLSAADLGLTGIKPKAVEPKAAGPVKRRKRKAGAAKSPSVPKFTDGQGNTWVGRGKRPQWLRDALASGKTLADLAIK